MNLSQLRAFVMVVEHGSFSEAARAMDLSQPAVTMQVQALESDLGVALFDRGYRKVGLTESGKALLPHARAVLAELESARSDIDRVADVVSGPLELAASTAPGQYMLPRLLGAFLREHSEVSATLRVMDTAEVVRAVADGDAQLGMTGAEMKASRVSFEPLGADQLVLICPPGHGLSDRVGITLADLADAPFVMRERGSGTRMVAEDVLRAGGLGPAELRVAMELGTSEAIVSAVEGGMGLGVVSRRVAEKALALGTVAEVGAVGFPAERRFYVVLPKGGMARAAEAFLGYLRERVGNGG